MSSGTTENPCECCEGHAPLQMLCRQRGGVASLIGYSEFVSPSTPPKKYLENTFTGISGQDIFTTRNVTCGMPLDCDVIQSWSGVNSYDPITGVYTEGGNRARTGSCAFHGVVFTPFMTPFAPAGETMVFTRTTGTIVCDLGCHPQTESGGPGEDIKCHETDAVETLTSEDTEANAIARLLAGGGGIWGDWQVTGYGSHGCLPQSCCLAQWTVRTTGFDINYTEDQYRIVNLPGTLLALTSYEITVEIKRRLAGVGSYATYLTRSYTVTTDINGDFAAFDDDVPNDEGFQTYPAPPFAVPSP